MSIRFTSGQRFGAGLKGAILVGCFAPGVATTIAFGAEEDEQLGEVVVTATRRSENLQDVPISVTAITAEALTKAGISDPIELPLVTPGLVMNKQASALTPFIRGVGSQDASAGQEAAVAIYIDGVYQASPYATNMNFNNVKAVEVDKGPQGTLFGRNATGGAIQVITKDPSHDPALEGSVGYGNYNTIDGSLYGTAGLTPVLAADIAVNYHDQRQGMAGLTVSNPEALKPIAPTYEQFNRDAYFSVRNKWLWTPLEDTKVVAAFDYNHFQNNDDARNLFKGSFLLNGCAPNSNYWNASCPMSVYPNFFGQKWDASLHATQNLSPFDLVSITAYSKTHVHQYFDNDFSEDQVVDVYIQTQYHTFTQELQLVSKPSSPIKWIGGLFYMNDTAGFGGPTGIGGDSTGITLIGSGVGGGVSINGLIQTKSYAAYGEATIPIVNNDNQLTIGARYSQDNRSLNGLTKVIDQFTYETIVAIPSSAPKLTNRKPTWRGMFDHHFTPDISAYVSVSRGFKSGDYNAVSPTDAPVRPETVTAYEIGAKSTLLDNHLRLNVAAYYTKYKDMQLNAQPGNTVITTNAGSAKIQGVEFEADALLFGGLGVSTGGSYMYSKFLQYQNGICFEPAPFPPGGATEIRPCDLAGTRTPRTPSWTVDIAPHYTWNLPVGKVNLQATFFHTASYLWEAGVFGASQPAYNMVNGSLGWTNTEDKYGFTFWVKNATQARYASYAQGNAEGVTYEPGQKRTYGGTFNFKF